MIAVADSGPVHYLVLTGQADLLFQFYQSLLIPAAVARELLSGGAPAKVTDFLASAPAWLRIESANPDLVRTVSEELDAGEREAIALAEHVQLEGRRLAGGISESRALWACYERLPNGS